MKQSTGLIVDIQQHLLCKSKLIWPKPWVDHFGEVVCNVLSVSPGNSCTEKCNPQCHIFKRRGLINNAWVSGWMWLAQKQVCYFGSRSWYKPVQCSVPSVSLKTRPLLATQISVSSMADTGHRHHSARRWACLVELLQPCSIPFKMIASALASGRWVLTGSAFCFPEIIRNHYVLS